GGAGPFQRRPWWPEGRMERFHGILESRRERLHAGQPRVRRAERELADLPRRALRPHRPPAGVPQKRDADVRFAPWPGFGYRLSSRMPRKAAHVLLALALVVTTTGLTPRVSSLGLVGHGEIEARAAAGCGAKIPGDGQALDARCAGEGVATPLSLSAVHPKSGYAAPVLAPAALAAP